MNMSCDIRTWEKQLFFHISLTDIDALVPSLYQCVETRSTEVLLSQPLPHLHFNLFAISETFAAKQFLADQAGGSHYMPCPGSKADT
jgi:hypothetical protein